MNRKFNQYCPSYLSIFYKVTFFFLLFFQVFDSISVESFNPLKIDSILFIDKDKIIDQPKEMLEHFQLLKGACNKIDYKLGEAWCDLYIGRCYYYLKEKENLDKCITGLIKRAELLDNDTLKINTKILRACQLGLVWMDEEALQIIDECFRLAPKVSNLRTQNAILGTLYTLKANYSAGLKNRPPLKTFLSYHTKALDCFLKSNKPRSIVPAFNSIGVCYLELEKPDSAILFFKKSLQFKGTKGVDRQTEYLNIGNAYLKQKNYQLALSYLDSAASLMRGKDGNYSLHLLYSSFAEVYIQIGNLDSVKKYNDLKDQFNEAHKKEEILNIVDTADKNQNELSADNKATKQIGVFIIIVFLLVIVCMIYIILEFFRGRINLTEENLTKNEEILQKDCEIIELKRKVSYTHQELVEMAKKDDALFISVFKELYPAFYHKLLVVQPDLTGLELKICFYLKLNFSTKEIADYTFVTVKAIQNRKNRLRKRLFLSEKADLYEFIHSLTDKPVEVRFGIVNN